MSSILIRRANMVSGGNSPRLPAGYTELAYLESTGTQYLNLGINGNVTFNVTAQCVTPSSTDNQALVCSTLGGTGGSFFSALTNGKWGVGTGSSSFYTSVNNTTKADIIAAFTSSGVSGTINGESYSRATSVTQGAWGLFAATSGRFRFKGKIWSVVVTQNSNKVMELVPAMRDSDSVVGMYDLVSNTFLTNAGTGTFNYGTL